jgi:hypothetical protein
MTMPMVLQGSSFSFSHKGKENIMVVGSGAKEIYVEKDLRGFIHENHMLDTYYIRSDLTQASYKNVHLDKSLFRGCLLKNITFVGCRLNGVLFASCCLQGAVFRDCSFDKMVFENCDMTNVYGLSGCKDKENITLIDCSIHPISRAYIPSPIFILKPKQTRLGFQSPVPPQNRLLPAHTSSYTINNKAISMFSDQLLNLVEKQNGE